MKMALSTSNNCTIVILWVNCSLIFEIVYLHCNKILFTIFNILCLFFLKQIQGKSDMGNWLLGIITRWDSDRYLSKTFSWAKYAYNPDVIVFLGDLMDEGSEGTDEELRGYVKRFHSIYDTKAIKIYVPGDNDIGGEAGTCLGSKCNQAPLLCNPCLGSQH